MKAPTTEKQISGQKPSLFRLVSTGTSVENLPRNQTMLNVLMNEKALATDGEISFNPEEKTKQFTDSDGQEHQVKSTRTRSIPCQWLPSEDNRVTPPNIRRNEIVEVWRLGDSTQYFWRSLGIKNGLRNKESVVYFFAAVPDEGGVGELDFTKGYSMQWSAHDRHVTIRTSKKLGEPVAWTMQFNTGEGEFTIKDDTGHEFEIVTAEKRIKAVNPDNSYFMIERKRFVASADEEVLLQCGGSSYSMKPNSITETTQTLKIDTTTTGITATGRMGLMSPDITMGGGTIKANAPGGFLIIG